MSSAKKIDWLRIFSFRSIAFTLIGVLLAIVGLQGFMVPNNFLDGGVTGLSILISSYGNFHISLLLLVFNIPFLIVGYHKISRTFGVQTLIAMLLLSAGMYFINIPVFTNDKVLIAIFGGFFIGLGIGCVIRGGGVIDGFEVIAQYTEKKSAFTSGEIILALNTLMIIGAALRFGIETGMYSILVYFTAMKTADYVVDGFEEYTALHIISKESEQIKFEIVNNYNKAVTVYKGERGFLPGSYDINTDCDIIMTVVTRLEIHRIKIAVSEIDPNAFIFVNSIKEVKGGIVRRNNKTNV
ncbi:YitT family protein [Gramella sp. GC03-9]|uniref:YitT family protein n=1 Tax=Christiangramia oceanisediminis TaxID=2920386 RepID=A0A9X2RAG2_9FLAO|nr:YitT family protein [Gramella oceanisediminis]MCP9201353.1 YitT family protein [Gramella oceanisediminis]